MFNLDGHVDHHDLFWRDKKNLILKMVRGCVEYNEDGTQREVLRGFRVKKIKNHHVACTDINLWYGGLDWEVLYPLTDLAFERVKPFKAKKFRVLACSGHHGDFLAQYLNLMVVNQHKKKDQRIHLLRQPNPSRDGRRRRFDTGERGKNIPPGAETLFFTDVVNTGKTLVRDILEERECRGRNVLFAAVVFSYERPSAKRRLEYHGITIFPAITLQDILDIVISMKIFSPKVFEKCFYIDKWERFEKLPGEEILPNLT